MAFFLAIMMRSVFSFRSISRKFIPNWQQPGLIISLALHSLLMLIPVSMSLVEQYHEELELFIIREEKPATHFQQTVERKIEKKSERMPIESSKHIVLPREKLKETYEDKKEINEEFQNNVDKLMAANINEIEKVVIRDEAPTAPLAAPAAPPTKEDMLSESPSLPHSIDFTPNQKTSEPVSTIKETVRPDSSQSYELEFGTKDGPKFLKRIIPAYPMMARRLGKEGRVILKLMIDDQGNLSNVEVIEYAEHGFTEAAVEAVKKSSFLPAIKDGKPVASTAILSIRFNLRSDK